jgi:hypothetical protein
LDFVVAVLLTAVLLDVLLVAVCELVTGWAEIAAALDVTPLILLLVFAAGWFVEPMALSELGEIPHPARSAIMELAARSLSPALRDRFTFMVNLLMRYLFTNSSLQSVSLGAQTK